MKPEELIEEENLLTPCAFTKTMLGKNLSGWLTKDEYIDKWEIDNDDRLILHIKRGE